MDFSSEHLQALYTRLKSEQETLPDRAFLQRLLQDLIAILESSQSSAQSAEQPPMQITIQTLINELGSLARVGTELASAPELQPFLQTILREAFALTGGLSEGRIFIFENDHLRPGAFIPTPADDNQLSLSPRPQGLTFLVARQGKTVSIGDMSLHPLYRETSRKGSILGIPLKIEERVVGTLAVYRTECREFSPDEISRLTRLGNLAAIGIEANRLRDLVDEQALHDPLTGIHNQHSLVERLEEIILQSHATGGGEAGMRRHSTGLMMIEINEFASIHKKYGKLAADYIFKEITFSINQALRKTDFLARFSRHDLVVLIYQADVDSLRHVALRIQSFVSQTRYNLPNVQLPALEVSIGVALHPENAATIEEWIAAAREALKAAKAPGSQGFHFSSRKTIAVPENQAELS